MGCKLEYDDGATPLVTTGAVSVDASVGGPTVGVSASDIAPSPSVSEWEVSGSKFRAMTPSFDLGVEPHDHFTWRWWVKDSEFGDVVATGYASDLTTAQQVSSQVGMLMEQDC